MIAGFFTPSPRRSSSVCDRGRFQTARIALRSRRRSHLGHAAQILEQAASPTGETLALDTACVV
jgi:hypothetical protein